MHINPRTLIDRHNGILSTVLFKSSSNHFSTTSKSYIDGPLRESNESIFIYYRMNNEKLNNLNSRRCQEIGFVRCKNNIYKMKPWSRFVNDIVGICDTLVRLDRSVEGKKLCHLSVHGNMEK